MDLPGVTSFRAARHRDDLALRPGERYVAGGTWLFSQPQPGVTGLVDLTPLGWMPWETVPGRLRIAATCTVAEALAAPWGAATAVARQCAESLLMSFKIQGLATVGGNLCLALPAGAMTSLTASLGGEVVVWTPDGGERREPVTSFVRGPGETSLAPGEVLRAVDVRLPAAPPVFRRTSLAPLGRSSAVVIGAGDRITLTASTARPVVIDAADPDAGLAAVDCWYDDPHGPPDWRAAVTARLAREVAAELGRAA
ncbi:FAD binding domain-containing protein [Nocardioides sp. 1609]|uniref:FAD binding domain-containing protein n=1 Tax=Nocardioides sp. 1609 TaxID=2508327 RepID=UPI00106FC46B|nr:FAD binding domain-containing protein [Nocardioides sp. 1609]